MASYSDVNESVDRRDPRRRIPTTGGPTWDSGPFWLKSTVGGLDQSGEERSITGLGRVPFDPTHLTLVCRGSVPDARKTKSSGLPGMSNQGGDQRPRKTSRSEERRVTRAPTKGRTEPERNPIELGAFRLPTMGSPIEAFKGLRDPTAGPPGRPQDP